MSAARSRDGRPKTHSNLCNIAIFIAFCEKTPPCFHAVVETYKAIEQVHIAEAARRLGVDPHYLRMLEWSSRIPPARRDLNGRIYSEFDIALLKAMGVGSRPRRLKRAEEALEAGS